MAQKYSSHPVLCTAIQFGASEPDTSQIYYVFETKGPHVASVFSSSRQIQNCLAPIVLCDTWFTGCGGSLMNYLLDQSDTVRFATTIALPRAIDDDLATRLLLRMDYVMEIKITATASVTDSLMPVIMALPHLQRVRFVSVPTGPFCHPKRLYRPPKMTYEGTIKPLLHHSRETVRRSVASKLDDQWLSPLSQDQKLAAYRDDFLPLLDSASNNGAACDAFVAACALHYWSFLPRDVVLEFFERALRFLKAPSSHRQLRNQALTIMHRCVDSSEEVGAETLNDFQVLPMLARMLRDRTIEPTFSGLSDLVASVFDLEEHGVALPQQVYDLQLLDLAYDIYMSPSRVTACGDKDDPVQNMKMNKRNPLSCIDLLFMLRSAIDASPLTFLQRSNIVTKLMRNVLVPWHRSTRAIALRFYRIQSAGSSTKDLLAVIDLHAQRFPPIRDAVHDAVQLIVRCLELELKSFNSVEYFDVTRLLFDEANGYYYFTPILQTYLHLALAHRVIRALDTSIKRFFDIAIRKLTVACEHEDSVISNFDGKMTLRMWEHPPSAGIFPPDSLRVRVARQRCDENERNGVAPQRWYLLELAMEDDVVFEALKRVPPSLGEFCDDDDCCGQSCPYYHEDDYCADYNYGYDRKREKYIDPDPYSGPKVGSDSDDSSDGDYPCYY